MTHSNSGPKQPLTISYGDSPELELKEIERLRHKVWSSLIGDQNIQRFSLDSFDLLAWHFAFRENNQLIASARLTFHTNASKIPDIQSFGSIIEQICWPCCFLGRMVVDPEYQGLGLSSTIDKARIALAKQLSAREAWIEIEDWRCSSMQKKGFSVITESDDTSIPGHWLLMKSKL